MPEVKCLELRDRNTFIPVICIRPVADNEAQRYLLRRDGYRADASEHCIIMIDAHNDPSGRAPGWRRKCAGTAHQHELQDGDVIDVEYILGETAVKKTSEAMEHA